jgi:hypothetical protein
MIHTQSGNSNWGANQNPTSNQQPATSNQQPATCNHQPATCNQQPATILNIVNNT